MNFFGWLFRLKVQTFQTFILIYRKGNFVSLNSGCTSIYRPLSYHFLGKDAENMRKTFCYSVQDVCKSGQKDLLGTNFMQIFYRFHREYLVCSADKNCRYYLTIKMSQDSPIKDIFYLMNKVLVRRKDKFYLHSCNIKCISIDV